MYFLMFLLVVASIALILKFWKTSNAHSLLHYLIKGLLCIAVILIGLLISSKLFIEFMYSKGSVIAESISPNKKHKIIIETEGFFGRYIMFYTHPINFIPHLKLRVEPYFFNCIKEELKPYFPDFDYGIGKHKQLSWNQYSNIFTLWNLDHAAPVPVCAFDIENSHRSFSYLDPYYYQFNLDTTIPPKQLVHYLFSKQPDYVIGFLYSAAGAGDIEILQQLFNEGVSLNSTLNQYPYSPLIFAIINEQKEAVKFLLSKGMGTRTQENAFVSASKVGNLDIVKTLLEYGADINEQDREGNTALIQATSLDNITLVRFLLSKGADRTIKNNFKLTALLSAQRWGHGDHTAEIIKLLDE